MTQVPVKPVGFVRGPPLGQGLAGDPDRPTVSNPPQAPTADQFVDVPRGEPELIGHLLDG